MNELYYFKNPGDPEISVALAGIHKEDWTSSRSGESFKDSVHKMSVNRFDILPIVEDDGNIHHCYRTKIWGNYSDSNIEICDIISEDRLYYLTHIHDAITKFANTKRKYFFLDNQHKIIGLITIGNLNCKHVYLYLYNLIIQLEHAMGDFIYKNGIVDKELVTLFEKRVGSVNAMDAVSRYKRDDQKGLDYKFIEYVYLMDLCFIFQKYSLGDKIGLEKQDLKSVIGRANELRKVVAHPSKSIIRNEKSIMELHSAVNGIDFLIEKLK